MTLLQKKLFLVVFAVPFLCAKAMAQYPMDKEVFFDSIQTFWSDKNKTDKAAIWAVAFQQKWPYSFRPRIDKILLPHLTISNNTEAETDFLEKLYLKNDSTINAFIAPLYFWNKIKTTNTASEVTILLQTFTALLKDSADFSHKTERFGLMVLNELTERQDIDKNMLTQLNDKIISNLEKYKYLDRKDAPVGSAESWQRHWFRCLYAFTYYEKYLSNLSLATNIEKAAYFSPDFIDKPFESELKTELALLYKGAKTPNYPVLYYDFLSANNQSMKALHCFTNITLIDPSDVNMAELKKSYVKTNLETSFSKYWKNKVDSIMIPFPPVTLKFNNGESVNFAKPSKYWTYVDVWATWCPPCIKELPEIEKYYQHLKSDSSYHLKLYTLSVNSTNLKKFIAKKKYTFPVSEIKEDLTSKLGVGVLPVKYLVSPERKFLEIPHGNWQEYIKNYTLTDVE